jgi:serine-type D-Ala-D-Ala carboxypeptidase (penicillin-binding protein 5/6)
MMNGFRSEKSSITVIAMQSNPNNSVQRMTAALRRTWRPTALVTASLLTVTAFAQPWSHSTPAKASATGSQSSEVATTVTDPTGGLVPTRPQAANAKNATLTINESTTQTIPGAKPKISWPHTGQSAIAIGNGHVLGISGKQGKAPTASMAKAMTAYIVLRDHPLKPGQNGPVIHVTKAEADVVGLNRRQAQQVLTVRAGEGITERQALNALMLKSANNVARILARWDAGSIPAFLDKMNANAKDLGMTSTHYTDPSGWHANTVSTTTDQIKLAETAMKRSDFARIVDTKTAIVPIEGRIKNVNPLLGQAGIVGIKTGSMSAAGGCLMFAAKHSVNGTNVWILGTVMGQRNGNIGDLHQAFASSKSLVVAMNKAIGAERVLRKGDVVAELPNGRGKLVATQDAQAIGWGGMDYKRTVKATVPANAKSGDKVGSVIEYGGSTLSVPVAVK